MGAGHEPPHKAGAMIPLDDAIAHVLAGCAPRRPMRLATTEAQGCVLAADVVAGEPVPPPRSSR